MRAENAEARADAAQMRVRILEKELFEMALTYKVPRLALKKTVRPVGRERVLLILSTWLSPFVNCRLHFETTSKPETTYRKWRDVYLIIRDTAINKSTNALCRERCATSLHFTLRTSLDRLMGVGVKLRSIYCSEQTLELKRTVMRWRLS